MLENSESHYRKLFEHNFDGVLITEKDGAILAANRAACALLKRSEDDLKNLMRDAVLDTSDTRLASLLQHLGQVGFAQGELRFRRSCGSLIEGEIYLSLFVERDGTQQISMLLRDLSELRHARMRLLLLNQDLEKKVECQTAELQSALKELEAFSYSVSHDLRGHVSTVNGFTHLLNKNFGQLLPAKGQHYLTRVITAGSKLARLIEDLLGFSKWGRLDMTIGECDVERLVQEVISETNDVYPDWHGKVKVGALPPSHGDTRLLRQLWTNLIGNAFKYSSKKEHPVIEVGFEKKDGEGVYFVRDNGDGFDMAHAGKLFEVFQRLHTDQEFVGTGVGLSIVKRITERHGGRVWAIGVPRQGATFSFTLGKQET